MDFNIPIWLCFITSWLGLTWGVYRLFKEAGDATQEDTRISIALWLLNFRENKETLNWPKQFSNLFDNIYTEKHWSIKCFARSVITSIVLFFIFSSIYFTKNFNYVLNNGEVFSFIPVGIDTITSNGDTMVLPEIEFWRATQIENNSIQLPDEGVGAWTIYGYNNDPNIKMPFDLEVLIPASNIEPETKKYTDDNFPTILLFFEGPSKYLILLFVTILLINILIDYLSLLESRYVIKLMSNTKSIKAHFLLLIADLVITFIIFIFGVLIFSLLYDKDSSVLNVFTSIPKVVLEWSELKKASQLFGILFYTTFFTSIWVWFYIASLLLIRLISLTDKGIFFLKKHLDIEEKPFRSIGFMMMIMITFGYIIWGVNLLL